MPGGGVRRGGLLTALLLASALCIVEAGKGKKGKDNKGAVQMAAQQVTDGKGKGKGKGKDSGLKVEGQGKAAAAAVPTEELPKPKPRVINRGMDTTGAEVVSEDRVISAETIKTSLVVKPGATLTLKNTNLLQQGVAIFVKGGNLKLTGKLQSQEADRPGRGIVLFKGATGTLEDCEISGLRQGFEEAAGVVTARNSQLKVVNCKFSDIGSTAVHFFKAKPGSTVQDSEFKGIQGHAILSSRSFLDVLMGNRFDSVRENAMRLMFCAGGEGKADQAPSALKIEKNTFSQGGRGATASEGSTTYSIDVQVSDRPLSIKHNTFTGGKGAISLMDVRSSAQLTAQAPAVAKPQFNSTITKNTIVRNTVNLAGSSEGRGTVVYLANSNVRFVVNTIRNNTVPKTHQSGTTMSIVTAWNCNATVANNTVTGNFGFARTLSLGGLRFPRSTYQARRNLLDNGKDAKGKPEPSFEMANDGATVIDARFNWWGTVKGEDIKKMTLDYEDDPEKGAILWYPHLSEARVDSPWEEREDETQVIPDDDIGSIVTNYNDYPEYDEEYSDAYWKKKTYHYEQYDQKVYEIIDKKVEWTGTEGDIVIDKNMLITKTGHLIVRAIIDSKGWSSPIKIRIKEGVSIRVDGILQIHGHKEAKVTITSDDITNTKPWHSIIFTSGAKAYTGAALPESIDTELSTSEDLYGCYILHATIEKGGGALIHTEKGAKAGKEGPAGSTGMVIVAGTRVLLESVDVRESHSNGLRVVHQSRGRNSSVVVNFGYFSKNRHSGISYRAAATLKVANSRFVENGLSGAGYAISLGQSLYNISRSSFQDNKAGVICVSDKRQQMEGMKAHYLSPTSYFESNTVRENLFARGLGCHGDQEDDDGAYQLISLGSGRVNFNRNMLSGNRAPVDALHSESDLTLIRIDKALRVENNTIRLNTGRIALGSYFTSKHGLTAPPLKIQSNRIVDNSHLEIVVTASGERKVFFWSNIVDHNSYSQARPFTDRPLLTFQRASLNKPIDVRGNEFTGNLGSKLFASVQVMAVVHDNLFENPELEAEIQLDGLRNVPVDLKKNWWGMPEQIDFAHRIQRIDVLPFDETKFANGGEEGGEAIDENVQFVEPSFQREEVGAAMYTPWMLEDGSYSSPAVGQESMGNQRGPKKVPKKPVSGDASWSASTISLKGEALHRGIPNSLLLVVLVFMLVMGVMLMAYLKNSAPPPSKTTRD